MIFDLFLSFKLLKTRTIKFRKVVNKDPKEKTRGVKSFQGGFLSFSLSLFKFLDYLPNLYFWFQFVELAEGEEKEKHF